jgi:deoxycytidylate deaminase
MIAGNKAEGGTAYITGHTYACESCKKSLSDIGVLNIVIGEQ